MDYNLVNIEEKNVELKQIINKKSKEINQRIDKMGKKLSEFENQLNDPS